MSHEVKWAFVQEFVFRVSSLGFNLPVTSEGHLRVGCLEAVAGVFHLFLINVRCKLTLNLILGTQWCLLET